MRTKIAGPQIAEFFPGGAISIRTGQSFIDPLAGSIDSDVVASGYGPTGQIVFALLLDGDRAGGAFEPQRLATEFRAFQDIGWPYELVSGLSSDACDGRIELLPLAFTTELLIRTIAAGTEIEKLPDSGISAQGPPDPTLQAT